MKFTAFSNNSRFITLREDYFDITGDYCAAKLIQYFSSWTDWKVSTHRTPWFYQPLRRIHDDLIGEHSENIIRRAISRLEELGLLERRHNPGNWQDKTWQYRLNLDRLNELLKERELKIEESNRRYEVSNRRSAALHNIRSKEPDPNNNNAVEEEVQAAMWEDVIREMRSWEMEVEQQIEESTYSTSEIIPQLDQPSEAALNCVTCNFILLHSDESEYGGVSGSQVESAIARSAVPEAIALPKEADPIPKVIVTPKTEGAVATSSTSQVQTVTGGKVMDLEKQAMPNGKATANATSDISPSQVVSGDGRCNLGMKQQAIASNGFSPGEAIATSNIPKTQSASIPPVQPSNVTSPPIPGPAKPKATNKPSQADVNVVTDALKYLRINPDVCLGVIYKFWGNVQGVRFVYSK